MGKFFQAGRPIHLGTALIAIIALLALAILGCNEPISTYQVSRRCITGDETVLVLPFMDTRTFVDNNDPHKYDMGNHARDIFVAAMRDNRVGKDSNILTPAIARQKKSLTNAEVAELGRQYGADLVVAGQVFSFTDTRAASIPARAGMFVRLVSSKDASLVFVGDHYQAAAVPGVGGGRDMQAKYVSNRLIEGICSSIAPAVASLDRVASDTALASIARIRKARTENNRSGKQDSFLEPMPLPPPVIDFAGGSGLDPATWDKQIAPEVPPMIDFGGMPAQPNQEQPAPVPLPPPAFDETGETPETAADTAVAPAPIVPPMPLPPPAPGETYAAAEEPATPARAEAAAEEATAEEPGDMADMAAMLEMADEVETALKSEEPETAGESEDQAEIEAEMEIDAAMAEEADEDEDMAESIEAAAETVAEDETAQAEPVELKPAAAESETTEPAVSQNEPDFYQKWINSGYGATTSEPVNVTGLYAAPEYVMPQAVSVQSVPAQSVDAADLTERTGDELASDLFESEDALLSEPAAVARSLPPAAVAPATSSEVAAGGEVVSTELVPMAPLELDLPGDGPVYSMPLAVEQPRGFRTVDLVLPEDPEAAAISPAPQMTDTARFYSNPGAIRVLLLPYHDRENPNNLISHTGGGEVVTTLYGTQLSQDPQIQVLWDASGQASHDRLVDRNEAIQLGKMVGADYVIRGQVVEFRRAQSVPSLYSAVISTAVLAAQMVFAEMSGVDVATEVYRVSDGACVMSRRDRAQQKYVVQAEKTVRRLAAGMATGVAKAMKDPNAELMDPLIDEFQPTTVLGLK